MAQIAGTSAAQTGECRGDKRTLQYMEIKHAFTGGGTDHGDPSNHVPAVRPHGQ